MRIAVLENESETTIDVDLDQVSQVVIGDDDTCTLTLKDGRHYLIDSDEAGKVVNAVLKAK